MTTHSLLTIKMPCCPSCGKGFKHHTTVANHMSQPTSGCNTWVDNLISLNNNLPASSRTGHVPLDLQYWTEDQMNVDTIGDDSTHTNTDSHIPADEEAWDHFLGVAQQYCSGSMFMDKFNMDKFSNLRTSNLYYPFISHEEWELALWLLCSGLSMRVIDAFLALLKVCLVSSHRTVTDSFG